MLYFTNPNATSRLAVQGRGLNVPAQMELRTGLSDDGRTATLEVVMNGNPLGHVILDIPEVEELIHQMAAIRSAMAEAVPDEIEPLARLLAADNPEFAAKIPAHSPRDGVLLALRHPGLGWLAFLLPHPKAEVLGQRLLDLSQPPSP
jgi:hypothetical protein